MAGQSIRVLPTPIIAVASVILSRIKRCGGSRHIYLHLNG